MTQVKDENRERNEYRREGWTLGIGSPARLHRYATARIKGYSMKRAKAAAYEYRGRGY